MDSQSMVTPEHRIRTYVSFPRTRTSGKQKHLTCREETSATLSLTGPDRGSYRGIFLRFEEGKIVVYWDSTGIKMQKVGLT